MKIMVLLGLTIQANLLALLLQQSLTPWVLLMDTSLVVAFWACWVWVDKRFPPSPFLWVETLEAASFSGGGMGLMAIYLVRGLGYSRLTSLAASATCILAAWLCFYGFCKFLSYYAERGRPF